MRELIYKVRLKSRDEFEERLSRLGYDFKPLCWQHSRIFVPKNYRGHENYPRVILRIEMRSVDRPAKYELIYKRHIESTGITIVHATRVKDYAETANILLQLGFVIQGEVPRRRQEAKIDEKTKVYMDRIDNQNGDYAKIEIELDEGEEVDTAREKLEGLLEEFGISKNERIKETYSELVS